MKRQPAALTAERLAQIERFAQRTPDAWSVSDAMTHHQQCRRLIVELVEALRTKRQLEQASLWELQADEVPRHPC